MAVRRTVANLLTAIALTGGVSAIALASQDKTLPASLGDLNQAQLVEIRDQTGQAILNGTLATSKNSPKKIERKAELTSPSGQKARGDVSVEIERKDGVATKDEVEFELENVPSQATLQLLIDGQSVTSFMTSKTGRAKFELSRKLKN